MCFFMCEIGSSPEVVIECHYAISPWSFIVAQPVVAVMITQQRNNI